MALEKDFKKEHNKLEYKYEQLYRPFYERRQKIIEGEEKPDIEQIREKLAELKINEEEAKAEKEGEKGIPEFWYKCLENCQDIMINEKDKAILKKLYLIKCTPEENGNFSLEFFFGPNDYFTNEHKKSIASLKVRSFDSNNLLENLCSRFWYFGGTHNNEIVICFYITY